MIRHRLRVYTGEERNKQHAVPKDLSRNGTYKYHNDGDDLCHLDMMHSSGEVVLMQKGKKMNMP